MSLAPGSFNRFPHYAVLIRDRMAEIRHEDAEMFRDLISQESPVDTGALRDSWRVYRQGDNTDVVESDRPYAGPVNDGHHTVDGGWVPGQHYKERAIERLRRAQAKRRLL